MNGNRSEGCPVVWPFLGVAVVGVAIVVMLCVCRGSDRPFCELLAFIDVDEPEEQPDLPTWFTSAAPEEARYGEALVWCVGKLLEVLQAEMKRLEGEAPPRRKGAVRFTDGRDRGKAPLSRKRRRGVTSRPAQSLFRLRLSGARLGARSEFHCASPT
jgi:hypothetical protein